MAGLNYVKACRSQTFSQIMHSAKSSGFLLSLTLLVWRPGPMRDTKQGIQTGEYEDFVYIKIIVIYY